MGDVAKLNYINLAAVKIAEKEHGAGFAFSKAVIFPPSAKSRDKSSSVSSLSPSSPRRYSVPLSERENPSVIFLIFSPALSPSTTPQAESVNTEKINARQIIFFINIPPE